MSDIESTESLRLMKVCFDLSANVLRHYADTHLLAPQYGSSFIRFLDKKKHEFYHLWQSCIPCCKCTGSIKPCQREMYDWMFYKLYFFQKGTPCRNPQANTHMSNGKIQRHCICRVLPVQTLELEDLDINILTFLLKHCFVSNTDIESINSLRGKLCHAANTKCFVKAEYDQMWKGLEDSILSLAKQINKAFYNIIQENLIMVKEYDVNKDKIMQLVSDTLKHLQEEVNCQNKNTKETKDLVKEQTDKLTETFEACTEDLRSGQSVIKQEMANAAEQRRQGVESILNNNDSNTDKLCGKIDVLKDLLLGIVGRQDACLHTEMSIKDSGNISDGKPKIRNKTDIGVQVDFDGLNEVRTIARLQNQTEDPSPCILHMKNAEPKCILLDMTAEKEIFQSEVAFKFAIDNLIGRIIEAGEIDTTKEKKMKITLTFRSPISDEQRKVVYSMLSKYGVLHVQDTSKVTESKKTLEPTSSAFSVEQDKYKGALRKVENQKTMVIEKKGKGLLPKTHGHEIQDSDYPDIKSEIKSDITDFDDRTMIIAENLIFHVRVKELPEKFQDLKTESFISETDDDVCYVEWKWICPKSFDVDLAASKIKSKIPELRDWFEIEYVSEDIGVITLHTKTPVHTFESKTSMDTAIRSFLLKTTEMCSIPTADAMSISVDVTVLSGLEESESNFPDSDENKEPEAKKRKTDTQRETEIGVILTQRFVDHLNRKISSLQSSLKELKKEGTTAKIRERGIELNKTENTIKQKIISIKTFITEQERTLSAYEKVLEKERQLSTEINIADVNFDSDWLICSFCKNIKPHKETYLCERCDKNICVHCYCGGKCECTSPFSYHIFLLDTNLQIYNKVTTFQIDAGSYFPIYISTCLRCLSNNDLIYNNNVLDVSTLSIFGFDGRFKKKHILSYGIQWMHVINPYTIIVLPLRYEINWCFYLITLKENESISKKINIPINIIDKRAFSFNSGKLFIGCTDCIKTFNVNGQEVGRIDFPGVEKICVFDNNLYCYRPYEGTLTHYDLITNTVCTSLEICSIQCISTDSEGKIFMSIGNIVCQADRNIQNLRIVIQDGFNKITQICLDPSSQHLTTLDLKGQVTVYKKTNAAER